VDGDDEGRVAVDSYALQCLDNCHSSGGVETCEGTGGEGDGEGYNKEEWEWGRERKRIRDRLESNILFVADT
jgi:hypothetical protein